MKKLEPRSIMNLRRWRSGQLANIKRREDDLAAQLRAAVPPCLKKWLEEAGDHSCGVIHNIIEFGSASDKYSRDDDHGRTYGYSDLEEFAQRFNLLARAWEAVVRIDISWDGDYRFAITFTAV